VSGCFFFPQASGEEPGHLTVTSPPGGCPRPHLILHTMVGRSQPQVTQTPWGPGEQPWLEGGGWWCQKRSTGVPETYPGSAWWEACSPRRGSSKEPVSGVHPGPPRLCWESPAKAKLMRQAALAARCLQSLVPQPGGRLFEGHPRHLLPRSARWEERASMENERRYEENGRGCPWSLLSGH